ncbi:Panacea domain-containing protein [Pseudoclavibacter helvolus]|uniref:Panacea domain-containing protein n=1 Tax=Pseudoclavibacter helvolus TaxID=255205 RepID=UPI003C75A32B
MTTMKLQKLCYYSQGWSLAWDEEPLFDEPIQAWANGPVVYALFDEHRGQFSVEDWRHGNPDALNADQRETVDAVLSAYGDLSGQQLSDKTHEERPWLEAREGLSPGNRSQKNLDLNTMQDFFGGLDQLND